MKTKEISMIQTLITISALIYCFSPDLLFGPFDDLFVVTVATIADIILGVSKPRLSENHASQQDFDF